MEESTQHSLIVLAITGISAFVGFIASSVALPMLTSQTALLNSLSCLHNGVATCLGSSDLINWFSIIVTFITSAIVLLSMSRDGGALDGEFRRVGWSIVASLTAIGFIVVFSWAYVSIVNSPTVVSYNTASLLTNFFSWPSVAVIASGGDPQPVWLISELIFVALFLLAYYRIGRD